MLKRSAILRTVLLALLGASLCACAGTQVQDTADSSISDVGGAEEPDNVIETPSVHISSISELNLVSEVDSHANAVGNATFELNRREYYDVPRTSLVTTTPYYPRLKQVSDDRYILFFNDGKTGPNVKYTVSSDLESWSAPEFLFKETSDTQYATCDAVVLDNGDILAVASFRPKDWSAYISKMDQSGIVIRRSTDGGNTWSDMKKIYYGMNWEPYIMQLSSGEVQIYFTHTAPYTYLYGYNSNIRSSGSAIIRSYDNGESWTPNVTSAPYAADRVMQTYIGMEAGKKYFNDQMPVAVQLNNGNILLACETLNLQKQFRISVGISYDNWKIPLGIEEAGPADKFAMSTHGSGPYVAQMKSGETVISYNSGELSMIIGDANGKNFSSPITPMSGIAKTYWGAIEVLGAHTLLTVQDDDTKIGSVDARRITYGNMYLNHDIFAKKTEVVVDGDPSEWKNNTDASFVGSESQAQASVRYSEDSDNLYILIERLDYYLDPTKDTTMVFLGEEGSDIYYKITVSADGTCVIQRFENKRPSAFQGDFECKVTCVGTPGNSDDTDTGYVAEIRLKKSDCAITTDNGIRTTLMLSNKDGRTEYANDTITGHDIQNMKTWQYVFFER